VMPQRHLKPVSPIRFLHEPHRFGVGCCRGASYLEAGDATTAAAGLDSPSCALEDSTTTGLGRLLLVCVAGASVSALSSVGSRGCVVETAAEMAADVSACCTTVSL